MQASSQVIVNPNRALVLVAIELLLGCSAPMMVPDGGTDAGTDAGAPSWRVVQDELPGALLSAWESPDGVLFAVGGTARTAFVLRHDANGWWQMDPGTSSVLWWVHGFSADDVWAVGANGVVTHFDGTRWSVEREEGQATLFGLFGTSRATMVAVGGVVNLSAPRPELLVRGGSSWSSRPPLGSDARPLFKVWGRSASDLFIVGERGLIARGNGTSWTVEASGVTDRLTTVHGNANETYAVGGIQRPVFLRRSSGSWNAVSIPGAPLLLNGVAVRGDGRVVIVGLEGYLAEGRGDTVEVVRAVTNKDLHAVLETRTGLVAVGGDLVQTLGRGVLISSGALAGGTVKPWPHGGVPLDAGVDAGFDGGVDGGVDAGLDGGSDAGLDAGFDGGALDGGLDGGADAGSSDAGLDGGLIGPGGDCESRFGDCEPALQCTMIFPWTPVSFTCSGTCADVSQCGAYGAGACCRVPNPQSFMSQCLPERFCDGGM